MSIVPYVKAFIITKSYAKYIILSSEKVHSESLLIEDILQVGKTFLND